MLKKISLLATMAMAACGGGSNSGTSTDAPSAKNGTYVYNGTVPGTLIEAFCANGAYYSTTSLDDGTTQHPFELELPAGLTCRLVMTTNEDDPANAVVTPLGFIDANGQLSTEATGPAGAVIDLGYIALFVDRESAAGHDADGDGILDSPMQIGAPLNLVIELEDGPDALDQDDDEIVDYYDDEDDDGTPNHADDDYSRRDSDRDGDGLDDDVDVNPDNDPDEDNAYPEHMDHDGDGYLDEDSDRDGYYDDDLDRDGLHDDDEDGDGFHDDDEDRDGFSDSENGDDAYAEVEGQIVEITDTGFVMRVDSAEGAAELPNGQDIAVDTSEARYDDVNPEQLAAGDPVEVYGNWDGTLFRAFKVEGEDD